jgi:hypothetical protein
VADEMALPTVDWFKTGTAPPGSEWDVSAEFDRRLTEDLGFGISDHTEGSFSFTVGGS